MARKCLNAAFQKSVYPPPLSESTALSQDILWVFLERGMGIPDRVFDFLLHPLNGLTRRDVFHLLKARGWEHDKTYLLTLDPLAHGLHYSREHICPVDETIRSPEDWGLEPSDVQPAEGRISPDDDEWEPEETQVSGDAGSSTAVPVPVVGRGRSLGRGIGRSSNWSESEEDSPTKRSRPSSLGRAQALATLRARVKRNISSPNLATGVKAETVSSASRTSSVAPLGPEEPPVDLNDVVASIKARKENEDDSMQFEDAAPAVEVLPVTSRVPVIGGAAFHQETDDGLGADFADTLSDSTVELED